MKTDDSSQERIKSRDLDKIQETVKAGGGKNWSGYGKALVFGGICFSLGLWIGHDAKPLRFETIRKAEALPVLFASRGVERLSMPMFSIVAMPKPARIDMPLAKIRDRRPLADIPAPIVKKPVIKQEKITKKTDKIKISAKSAAGTDSDKAKKAVVSTKKSKNGFYSIQVRAFQDRAEAMSFFKELKAQGYGVWAEMYKDPSGVNWTRVFVGRFKSRAMATRFQARFKKMQNITGLVVLKHKTTKISRKKGLQNKRGENAKKSH